MALEPSRECWLCIVFQLFPASIRTPYREQVPATAEEAQEELGLVVEFAHLVAKVPKAYIAPSEEVLRDVPASKSDHFVHVPGI